MHLITFVLTSCRGMVVLSGFTALLSGACNVGLIALISRQVSHPTPPTLGVVTEFVSLLLGKLGANFISQVALTRLSQRVVAELRQQLVNSILAVPLRQLEDLGVSRLLAALTDDVNTLAQALYSVPILSVNLAILFGGAVYLCWLSWGTFINVIVFVIVAGYCYRLLTTRGFSSLHLAREAEDRLFADFRALTEGIKELKCHRQRRADFTRDLRDITEIYQRHNVTAEIQFIIAHSGNHLLCFMLIGLILFSLHAIEGANSQIMTGYVLTIIYLMGPFAGVMSGIPLLCRAQVSLNKIKTLGLSLTSIPSENSSNDSAQAHNSFHHLELHGVTHTYHSEREDDRFLLGPITLQFKPGEIVFLVGGNGSGKSTLAKILTGLYPPESGEIRLDGEVITNQNRDDYRQLFSTVFADFYLFERLLGFNGNGTDHQAKHYLQQLHLQHKVSVRDGALSTTALSQGQRKRLALLTAYIEDRPFYLFDEWACDQDPHFKEIFYTQLLPELKARGKTVLAITHDDHYFKLADRLIKLDFGQLDFETRSQSSFSSYQKPLQPSPPVTNHSPSQSSPDESGQTVTTA